MVIMEEGVIKLPKQECSSQSVSVPDFNLPANLSEKLWKSMRMAPKKLRCEKEFYMKDFRDPKRTKTVWKCVAPPDHSKSNGKQGKGKAKAKPVKNVVEVAECDDGDDQQTSSPISRKAKLLSKALKPDQTHLDKSKSKKGGKSPVESPTKPPHPPVLTKTKPTKLDKTDSDTQKTLSKSEESKDGGVSSDRNNGGSFRALRHEVGGRKRAFDDSEAEGKLGLAESGDSERQESDRLQRMGFRVKLGRFHGRERRGVDHRESARAELEGLDSMSDEALALRLHHDLNAPLLRKRTRSQRGGSSGDGELHARNDALEGFLPSDDDYIP